MLKIIDCEQGTREWLSERLGVPTASEFETLMKSGRGKNTVSKTALKYIYMKAAERITEELPEEWSNQYTRRGHELEPVAVELYEEKTGNKTEVCGFMKNEHAGYSPDRIVGDNGLIEVKTKKPELQVECIVNDVVPDEHMKQMQAGLWISGRDWCDFVSYCPNLPLFVKRVERDEKMIEQIKEAAIEFNRQVDEIVTKVLEAY